MKYTGINRFFQSASLQTFFDKHANGTISEFLDDWRWIFSYSKRYKWAVLLYTILGILSSTLGIASAYISGMTINIITGRQTERLALLLSMMIGMRVFNIVFNAIKSRISIKISIRVHNDIQAEIFGRIIDVQWDALNHYKRGDLLNRFNNDVNSVSDNAISWIPDIIISIYTFAASFIVLYKMDPIMAWIGLCSAPILLLASRYLMKRQKEYRKKVLELNSDMMSFETEAFYNMDAIKSFGAWDVISQKLYFWQGEYKKNNLDYNSFRIKTNAAISLLRLGVTMLAFCYCLYRLWTGQILYGDMTFFLNQRNALTNKFNSLIETIPAMLNAAISTHRIREIVELPKEKHDPELFDTVSAKAKNGFSIELNDVSFAYSDKNKVYENSSFIARPGEIVAVIGESGGGKTTLFRLLLGLVHPKSGEVILRDNDGVAIHMNADLRQLISYVPQGNTLLMGTVAENMRLVKKNATDEEIIEALKTACAWDFVQSIGIDSPLGERGAGLSEGQAQRISIARALLRDAPILFLDEATSALDEDTEEKVISNVVKASANKTIIVSTHRPSVLKKCVRVYKIQNKRIM